MMSGKNVFFKSEIGVEQSYDKNNNDQHASLVDKTMSVNYNPQDDS